MRARPSNCPPGYAASGRIRGLYVESANNCAGEDEGGNNCADAGFAIRLAKGDELHKRVSPVGGIIYLTSYEKPIVRPCENHDVMHLNGHRLI